MRLLCFIKAAARTTVLLLCVWTNTAAAEDVCNIVKGAVILAQDGKDTFLGKITNSLDSQSIFNEFGTYGNPFSLNSIWNEFSTFGNEFSSYSPFNQFSLRPPVMIRDRKILGYLTANKNIKSSISPNLLKALCKDAL